MIRPDARLWTLLAIAVAGAASWWFLGLRSADLVPSEGGARSAFRFAAAAVTPAFDYADPDVPSDAVPFLQNALLSAWRTVVFAVASISLSLVLALPLGFLASSSWWAGDGTGSSSGTLRRLRCLAAPVAFWTTRAVIALMRSVHELLWAVLFLCAMGLSELTAVIAIAIPYTGTLAKLFSEMVDEAPRDVAVALRSAGAGPAQVFVVGLLPRALPDMTGYAFYRFECALRSSAILGFFGLPTLGLSIKQSFDNLHFGEVWTYLYLLFALIAAVEAWSGAVRRRQAA